MNAKLQDLFSTSGIQRSLLAVFAIAVSFAGAAEAAPISMSPDR